jgi:hypothetical protein
MHIGKFPWFLFACDSSYLSATVHCFRPIPSINVLEQLNLLHKANEHVKLVTAKDAGLPTSDYWVGVLRSSSAIVNRTKQFALLRLSDVIQVVNPVSTPKHHITITRYIALLILIYNDIKFASSFNNTCSTRKIVLTSCIVWCYVFWWKESKDLVETSLYIHRKKGRKIPEVIAMKTPKYHNRRIFKKIGINIMSVEATVSPDLFILL